MTTEIKFPPAPEPVAYRLCVFGRAHRFVVHADVADEEKQKLAEAYGAINVDVDGLVPTDQLQAYAGPIIAQRDKLLAAMERIADPRNTHFAGDAQVVARAALAKTQDLPAILQPQAPL